MIDEEMYALLSAYAAGTLTKDEEKRLFEKSLHNQTLFDALADEESMRATLANPLVKKQLLLTLNHANNKRDNPIPPQNRWLWVAVAASLFVGAATIYYWPTAATPKPQEVAVSFKPAEPTAAAPIEESNPKPPVATRAKQALPTQPAERDTDTLGRQTPAKENPAPAVEASGVIAPPQALVVRQPDQRKEAKAELADQSAPKSLAFTPVAGAVAERTRNAAPMAKVAADQPVVELSNDLIHVRPTSGYLYMFLIDGAKIQPIAITLPLTPASARSLPMPDHANGSELWFLYTPTEDPVLARALTGVLPLPSRPWVKLKLL